jgi:hypothetical protein
MSAGEVLDGAFQIYRRHFRLLYVTALLPLLPAYAAYIVTGIPAGDVPADEAALVLGMALSVLMLLGSAVVYAALSRQIDGVTGGRTPDVSGALRYGVRRLVAVVAMTLLLTMLWMVLLVPIMLAGLAGGGIGRLVAGAGAGMAGAAVAGGVVGVVLVVWWASIGALALPALVVEDVGPLRAISRARELARGARLRVTAVTVAAFCIVLLPYLGVMMAFDVLNAFWDPTALQTMTTTKLYVYQVASLAVAALTPPLLVGALTLQYYDRRARREGYDIEIEPTPQPSVV